MRVYYAKRVPIDNTKLDISNNQMFSPRVGHGVNYDPTLDVNYFNIRLRT